jgi:hypothetical protein
MNSLAQCGKIGRSVLRVQSMSANVGRDLTGRRTRVGDARVYVCLRAWTEIGIGLTGMGLLFTMLGVLLFFDGGLLAVGNVSLVLAQRTLVGCAPLRNHCNARCIGLSPKLKTLNPLPCAVYARRHLLTVGLGFGSGLRA